MARARNIKPSLFKNELLGQADPLLSLLFISLWTLADKAGRLEDRPLRIKAETFPYRDGININGYLTELLALGFIERYEVDGVKIIEVVNFTKHQTPHSTEKASELPCKPIDKPITLNNESASVNGHINVLITDSSNTDSLLLIPDSLIPDSLSSAAEKSAPPKKLDDESELQLACKQTWKSYADAFFNRYGTEPVRNAKVNGQVKNFVKRIGYDESPLVASFYLTNNTQYYVSRGHSVDCLLADAEKIRMEWATGSTMTATRANQIDKSQANRNAVDEAMKLIGA
jgi:hypothetical protein